MGRTGEDEAHAGREGMWEVQWREQRAYGGGAGRGGMAVWQTKRRSAWSNEGEGREARGGQPRVWRTRIAHTEEGEAREGVRTSGKA